MRNVHLELNIDKLIDDCDNSRDRVQAAIGRLATYNMTYDTVYLYSFHPGEITACYSRLEEPEDKQPFVICAIYDKQKEAFSNNS